MAEQKKIISTNELFGQPSQKKIVKTSDIMPPQESQGSIVDDVAGSISSGLRSTAKFALERAGEASEFLDRYNPFGAPLREAIKEAQRFDPDRNVAKAYLQGFGKEDAATGKEIAEGFRIPSDVKFELPIVLDPFKGKKLEVTPAGVVGGLIEVASDPLTYFPTTELIKAARMGTDVTRLGKVGEKLTGFAETRAAKAGLGENARIFRQVAGLPTKGVGSKSSGIKRVRELGRTLIDDKVIGLGRNIDEIAPIATRNKAIMGQIIGEYGNILDEVFPDGVIDPKSIANQVRSYAETIPGTVNGKRLRDRLLEEADNFDQMPRLGFSDSIILKNQFGFKPESADLLISNKDTTNKVYGIIADHVDDAIKSAEASKQFAGDLEGIFKGYKDANKRYSQYRYVDEAAKERRVRQESLRFISPSDYGLGIGSAIAAVGSGADATVALLTGLAGSKINNLLRTRGPAFAARTADALGKAFFRADKDLSKWLPKLQAAAASGNVALITQHNFLMNNDDEYRQKIQSGIDQIAQSDFKNFHKVADAMDLAMLGFSGVALPIFLFKKGSQNLKKAAKELVKLNVNEDPTEVKNIFLSAARKADPDISRKELEDIWQNSWSKIDNETIKKSFDINADVSSPTFGGQNIRLLKTDKAKTRSKGLSETEKRAKRLNEVQERQLEGFDPSVLERVKQVEQIGSNEPYIGRSIHNQVYYKNRPERVGHANQLPLNNYIPDGQLGRDVLNGGADPFAWLDSKYGVGKRALEMHKGKDLNITTRSDLIAHDDYIELLDPKRHKVGIVIPNANDRISRVIAPGDPSQKRKINAAKKLKDQGIDVTIYLEGIPNISGNLSIDPEIIKDLANSKIKVIPTAVKDFDYEAVNSVTGLRTDINPDIERAKSQFDKDSWFWDKLNKDKPKKD